MLFNSFEYIFLFLPASVIVFFLLNRYRLTLAAKGSLILFSLFFYCWWKPSLLPVILVSIMFNYLIGSALLQNAANRSAAQGTLALGIALNLMALGFFKYTGFFIENVNAAFGASIAVPHIILPLGISFFTFTQIAYLVDTYKGKVREQNFLNYILFVTYFPHLLAGPILHHAEMMPQFDRPRGKVPDYRNLYAGFCLFAIGMFKKVIIADNLAHLANPWLDAPGGMDAALAWSASLAYTMQLYFDFSGYTDMAIAAALMINIRLPHNFNSPYRALDIQDFWRRWHMTLSRFLRDYVYIPLGGNRAGEGRLYMNLFLTFLLGGIWHGAGWTFVAWGCMHGAAVVIHRAWQTAGYAMPRAAAWLLTFLFVNTAWVFFRAASMENALTMLRKMYLPGGADLASLAHSAAQNHRLLMFVAAGAGMAFFARNSNAMARQVTPRLAWSITAALVLVAAVLSMELTSPFLYFNF